MCDKFLITELLQRIETSLEEIIDWTVHVKSVNDFLLFDVIIKMKQELS